MVDGQARRIAAVTTSHKAGYKAYSRQMAETFDQYWPADVPLLFYTEGFDLDVASPRILGRDLVSSCPELIAFKARHADSKLAHGKSWRIRPRIRFNHYLGRPALRGLRWGLGYRWDAVRFAHKSFAILHAARNTDADVLIWVDADTRFFAPLSRETLEGFVPQECFVGCLRRWSIHTETGFLAFNLRHPATMAYMDGLERLYTEDLLFKEYEYHDAYLFDVLRERLERQGHRTHDIAEGAGKKAKHVLVNSPLGRFMDHMKGGRKETGSSSAADLVTDRGEDYWNRKA
ncbi:hypothetical protein ACFSM5_17015 [Lacibacterium aquatile]|uniref:Glycosyl transferase n=1 Tax=Lacibacterium aquatile TaxID=1168082 RepID=A0ABW5DTY7_9PROT